MNRIKINLELPVAVRDLVDVLKADTGLPITRIVGAALHHYGVTMTDVQRTRAQKAFARWLSGASGASRALAEAAEHAQKGPEGKPGERRRA